MAKNSITNSMTIFSEFMFGIPGLRETVRKK